MVNENNSDMNAEGIAKRANELNANELKVLRGEVDFLRSSFIKMSSDQVNARKIKSQVAQAYNEIERLRSDQDQYLTLNGQIWSLLCELERPFKEEDADLKDNINILRKRVDMLLKRINSLEVNPNSSRPAALNSYNYMALIAVVVSIISLFI